MNRRALLTGLVSFVAAPAIVRVSSLMPVKLMTPTMTIEEVVRAAMENLYAEAIANINRAVADAMIYGVGVYEIEGTDYRIEMPSAPLVRHHSLVSFLKERAA